MMVIEWDILRYMGVFNVFRNRVPLVIIHFRLGFPGINHSFLVPIRDKLLPICSNMFQVPARNSWTTNESAGLSRIWTTKTENDLLPMTTRGRSPWSQVHCCWAGGHIQLCSIIWGRYVSSRTQQRIVFKATSTKSKKDKWFSNG